MTRIHESPRTIVWSGIELVRKSDVPGLEEWSEMNGGPIIVVEEEDDPFDWIAKYDYFIFLEENENNFAERKYYKD